MPSRHARSRSSRGTLDLYLVRQIDVGPGPMCPATTIVADVDPLRGPVLHVADRLAPGRCSRAREMAVVTLGVRVSESSTEQPSVAVGCTLLISSFR